jgi:hypothetical protein
MAAKDSAELAYRYFIERQPAGYVSNVVKGTADRKVCLQTATEKRCLELIADYYLAEDHVRGLALTEKARKDPEDDEVYPPLGEGARRVIDDGFILISKRDRVRVCEICRSDFVDESPAKNAKVCGDSCRKWKGAVEKQKKRNGGDGRLKRDRERQDYEYPFYNPRELFEISTKGESLKAGSDTAADRAKLRQERGVKKPTDKTMDFAGVYSPNNYKRWRSEDKAKELAGPVDPYNLRDTGGVFKEEWTESRKVLSIYLGHLSL